MFRVDEAVLAAFELQALQDAVEGTVVSVLREAVVDSLPGTVAFGQVTPGGARAQDREDAVDDGVVFTPGASFARLRLREEIFDQPPIARR